MALAVSIGQHNHKPFHDGMPMKIPVAVMDGAGEGVADLHYGNNVQMPAGHRLRVTVTLKGQRAVFGVTSPKIMGM